KLNLNDIIEYMMRSMKKNFYSQAGDHLLKFAVIIVRFQGKWQQSKMALRVSCFKVKHTKREGRVLF
ncbi:MAG: hypothetical protein RR310_06600, partial [Eubacterium sp.]